MTENLNMLDRALESMKGVVVPESEMPSVLWVVQILRYEIGAELGSVNWHLEKNAQALTIIGYYVSVANSLLKTRKLDLARAEASLYNGRRSAGEGRHGKAPSQKALEMLIDADPDILERRGAVVRMELYRDVLKELRDAIHSRSRHLEHISNNVRFEGRIDTAV